MKILLATDGSEFSEGAARFLTQFPLSSQDEIIAIHVVTELPYDDDYAARLRHLYKKVSPKILRSSVDILKPLKAMVTLKEEEGTPDEVILRVAVDSGADLIVMGARGIKGIRSFFIGSVTRSVVINSVKPVFVIKPAPLEISKGMKILFATDGSASSLATGRLLASMPWPDGAEMVVMNVAWSGAADLPDRFADEIDSRIKDDVAAMRTKEFEKAGTIIDQAKASLSNRFTNVEEVIRSGDPAAEILEAAERRQANIIAVGSRGLRGFKGMIGSVSRRVLGHSSCHVLIGKAPEG